MQLESHPFNDNFGLNSLKGVTTKIILGSFPPYQITSNGAYRLYFYYGSTDNRFWDLIWEVYKLQIEVCYENIIAFLETEKTGVIDIIRKCYRKSDRSSGDEDLCIIELEDMPRLLSTNNIDTVYSTSRFVTNLLKKQIEPLLERNNPKEKGKKLKKGDIFITQKVDGFIFEKVWLPAETFSSDRYLSIKTLISPSDMGLRGIGKLLTARTLNTEAASYRLKQYQSLLIESTAGNMDFAVSRENN